MHDYISGDVFSLIFTAMTLIVKKIILKDKEREKCGKKKKKERKCGIFILSPSSINYNNTSVCVQDY